MAEWTLKIGSETKTIAAWKLTRPVLNLVNLGRDILTAQTAAEFDSEGIAEFGDSVQLYRDEVKWFDGECFIVPRSANGTREAITYSFVGPWNFLERNTYKMPWYRASNGSTIYTSHLLFPLQSVAQHITDALTYAIARGANLQIGTITAPIIPPSSETTDITIAGVLRQMATYAPDCVGYLDYSTTPPTFHFKPRSALTAVTLQMPSSALPFGSRLEVIEPVARQDLQVDNVVIIYEILSQIDGRQKFGFTTDVHPPATTGLEDGCLSAVVNLQGSSSTTVQGSAVGETIELGSLDWWRRAVPALNDARIQNLAFAGTPERIGYEGEASLGFGRSLVDGQLAAWMTNPDGSAVDWQKERILCKFTFSMPVETGRGDAPALEPTGEEFHVNLTATNIPAGETDFQTLATFEDGDAIPVGMAQYLYNSLHPLQYDALFVQHKAECDGEVRLGNIVNLTGALSEWATMNALVQQVVCDIDKGTTEITCGPPRHLSIDQILALLRVGRVRRRWTNPSTQTDGNVSAQNVELGKATANNNTAATVAEFKRFVVTRAGSDQMIDLNLSGEVLGVDTSKIFADFGDGKTLTIDAANALWEAVPQASRAIALREVCVKVNGESKKMLVPGTLPYT